MHYQPAEFYWIPREQAFEIVPLNPFAGTGGFRPLVVPTFSTIEVQLPPSPFKWSCGN